MLKKLASSVLASFRPETPPPHQLGGAHKRGALIRRTVRLAAALPADRRVLARRGWAGEKSELFEHPAQNSKTC